MKWLLDPDVIYLNHGSFGACPEEILAEQSRWRARLERNPMRFFVRELEQLLDESRARLAAFVGARPEQLAFVPNATFGCNAVARSLSPGSEVLVTSCSYNACVNAFRESGADLVVAQIPLPVETEEEVVGAILGALTPKTQLALIDHVTSPTAMIWPVAKIVAALRERGVATLVDGAHAPGMLALDIESLGADYYIGNCHKWMCAPKGVGFLWDRRAHTRPPIISHGANSPRSDRSKFHLEFDWTGTSDPTACLCLPAVIDGFDWPSLRAHNRALALEGRSILSEALEVPPLCPDAMIGSMAAIPLPPGDQSLQLRLAERGIEVPIILINEHRLVRISAQRYNRAEDYRILSSAILDLLDE
jgi:isopenicillin-N epimerase